MESVRINDVKKYGITILTGEACAISMRLLCELTPEMMQIYINYTGIQVNINDIPKSSYNNYDKFAVFLTREVIEDLVIMNLLEQHEFVQEIQEKNSKHFIVGTREEVQDHICEHKSVYSHYQYNEETDRHIEVKGIYDVGRNYSFYSNPRRGFSNVHAFSGTAH